MVSVALWVPAVFQSTAWFYYENRGLWALIMAQIGLEVYAGDQVRLQGMGHGLVTLDSVDCGICGEAGGNAYWAAWCVVMLLLSRSGH